MLCALVQLLHYILNCNHFGMTLVILSFQIHFEFLSKLLESLNLGIIFRNGRRVHRFILCQKYICSRWFCNSPPPLRLCIALFAVAEDWLLLDLSCSCIRDKWRPRWDSVYSVCDINISDQTCKGATEPQEKSLLLK